MRYQFHSLWMNHPRHANPCDTNHFLNQCAIRMSETFHKAGIDTKSFDNLYPNRRCYPSLKHNPAHILAAQELANWIKKNEMDFGKVQIIKDDRRNALKDKQGILFILNGWSSTDHIDLWNGSELRGGYDNYLEHGTELWFWPLA